MKFDVKVRHLVIVLGLIILVIPPLLKLPAISKFFDFSSAGQVGDTIGGITAPFINAIGAILVFLAFKEQIKANNLIKEQQLFQHIQEQIHRLEDNFIDLSKVNDSIYFDIRESSKLLNNFDKGVQKSYFIRKSALNKALYTTTVFELTADIINKMESNKDFLFKKLKMVYLIIYQDKYQNLDKYLKGLMHMESSTKALEADLMLIIKGLEEKFGSN
ncbi:hypothetical protein I2I11_03460 [Pontibacter sp. 172403-2]|uniref:hypothetical protein n=1 Tax=Pontibacter rufus TaxID=2791028 RepID=UPI0018AF7274|nr:hypothetical protein [Pontibacter sp. 172403-2]MBF9252341.1 hypothetical protein [Pontibacter sp. 172403-2]